MSDVCIHRTSCHKPDCEGCNDYLNALDVMPTTGPWAIFSGVLDRFIRNNIVDDDPYTEDQYAFARTLDEIRRLPQ